MFDPKSITALSNLDKAMHKVETMHLRDRPLARGLLILAIIMLSIGGIAIFNYLGDLKTLLLPGMLVSALLLESLFYRRAVRISMDNITKHLEGFVKDPSNTPELVRVFNALRHVLDWGDLHWYTRQCAEGKLNGTRQKILDNVCGVLENATKENGAQEDPFGLGTKVLYGVDVNNGFFHPVVLLEFNNGTLRITYRLVMLNDKLQLCSNHVINLSPELEEKIYNVLIAARKSLGYPV